MSLLKLVHKKKKRKEKKFLAVAKANQAVWYSATFSFYHKLFVILNGDGTSVKDVI